MKNIYAALFLFLGFISAAQPVCSSSGNLMIFTNYDGGTLNISIDQNIPNLKIGICTYEACIINLSGPFLSNVTAVHYAGFNSNNNHCGSPIIAATVINGAPIGAVTTTVFSPAATISNPNGNSSIICGYSCNNTTNQGGCNTVDQVDAYFLNYFAASSLYAHFIQYNCWAGTYSLSAGGNCCPPPVIFPGTISASQTLCAGSVPAAFSSVSSATVSTGTISYQWQSSTTSPSAGFTNIPGANAVNYVPPAAAQTTYYRRAASISVSNIAYSNVITVTVLPLFPLSIGGPTAVCAGSSVTLSASGGTSYAWSGQSTTASSLVITPTTGLSVLSVTCYPSNGCNVTATHSIMVHALPLVVAYAVDPSICIGMTNTLNAISIGNSLVWQPGNLAGNMATITPVSTVTMVYTVTATSPNNCTNTAMASVVVKPLPIITITAAANPVCSARQTSLEATGALSFTWMPGGSTSWTLSITPTAAVVYTVTGFDSYCLNTATISLDVIPSPTVTFLVNRDKICVKETATISASGGATYAWLNPGVTAVTSTVAVSPTLTTSYSVVATGTNGCTDMGIKSVTVSFCSGISAYDKEPLFNVYPNPNSGEFIVSGTISTRLELISSSGQLVKQFSLDEKNNYKISVKDLPEGIYFIVSGSGEKIFKQKIIVSK